MRRTITALFALAFATMNIGLAVGPAFAADQSCQTIAADIRAAAATADEKSARRAFRKADIGERLCQAGNERAADKQFTRALKALGLTEKELAQR